MDENGQFKLAGFLSGNEEKLSEQKKQYLKRELDTLLGEVVKLYLTLLPKDWAEIELFLAFIRRKLEKMEIQSICFVKRMPNGKTRIYRKYYCCGSLDDWKKCPEKFCKHWPNNEPNCPRLHFEKEPSFESYLDSLKGVEVIWKDNPQNQEKEEK